MGGGPAISAAAMDCGPANTVEAVERQTASAREQTMREKLARTAFCATVVKNVPLVMVQVKNKRKKAYV